MKRILTLLILTGSIVTAAAQTTISGKIITSDGNPAGFVNIELKETGKTTITNQDGYYEVKDIGLGSYRLVVSYVGLQTQTKHVQVTKAGGNIFLNLVLTEDSKELEEVIVRSAKKLNNQPVSAGKISINPMDLPQSITVVGQSVIRDQQAQRLSDVIKNVNGVYLSTTRANVQESFSARGYAFSSSNMFKNGSRVNAGVMPEMSSLERVEILKGSAAILYGNVSPGGIINMVTKQPKFHYGAEASLRVGSYGLIKPAIDVYGPISKRIAFRVNGTYEKANSYRDIVNSERFYINPSFLFKLGKRTDLLVQGDYLDTRFTPDFGIGSLDNTIIPDVPRSTFLGTSWQYNKVKQTTATASLKHKLSGNWSLNVTTSYQQYDRDYYSTERIQAKANGDWVRPLNKIDQKEDYMIGQLDLTGKFKTGKIEHTLLAGIDADRYFTTSYTFNNRTTYDTINILDPGKFTPKNDIPAAIKVTRIETPINRVGAYVQDLISLSSKFKLLAGLRWSQQESRPATTSYLLKDSVATGIAKKDAAFSPRVGLVYKPTNFVSAFASYANSFSVNTGTDIYNNALQPSIIDQYEVGVKTDLLKNKLSVNLTMYKIINNNLAQTAQFTATGAQNSNTSIKEMVGQTTSDGVELDINSQPIHGLNIMAGYSYNYMRFSNVPEGKGYYVEGERLVNTPAHTANTSVFYTIQQGGAKGLKFGASVFYIGDRWGGWNNQQQQTQTYSRLIKVEGFTTVDLSAGYSFKKVSVLAKVSNLFNTYSYYVHENYSVNPIAPIQFSGTVSVKL